MSERTEVDADMFAELLWEIAEGIAFAREYQRQPNRKTLHRQQTERNRARIRDLAKLAGMPRLSARHFEIAHGDSRPA